MKYIHAYIHTQYIHEYRGASAAVGAMKITGAFQMTPVQICASMGHKQLLRELSKIPGMCTVIKNSAFFPFSNADLSKCVA